MKKMLELMNYWTKNVENLISLLKSDYNGLSQEEAIKRINEYGPNILKPSRRINTFSALLNQFKSPIIILLLLSAFLAFLTGDQVDGTIISLIVLVSSLLGFWQERMATNAIEKLISIIHVQTTVIRDGNQVSISIEQVVPGDIIILTAGDIIPADSRLIEVNQLFVNEASLTGETFPVEKNIDILNENTPFSKRINLLFMGTHVISGTGKAIVVHTGQKTEF